ncbi:hypothetical protein [Nocardia altamirensis]|uniref:hypothetical protein n=1 Tax=Nocardia altamirensis TaxID=472158 RepID=UPI001FDF00F3|nr:hypothetical protein [Nocardia altamirensis]
MDSSKRQPATDRPAQVGWNPFTRIAFRFCFVYFGLYCVIQPMFVLVLLGGMAFQLPPDLLMWQHTALGPGLAWVGRTVFGVDAAWHSSGSGDQTIDWVLEFCLLVFAWSRPPRGRHSIAVAPTTGGWPDGSCWSSG